MSGNAENGSFRLIFVNGELKGVYVIVDGKEFVGEKKALNMIEGIARVKVYASLGKPEEVLSPRVYVGYISPTWLQRKMDIIYMAWAGRGRFREGYFCQTST